MDDTREKLSKNLNIPLEEASRILIEKQKSLAQSEIKYHLKSVCRLLDTIKRDDSDYSEAVSKEAVKFLIARHASVETIEELSVYLDSLSENYIERAIVDRIKDDY